MLYEVITVYDRASDTRKELLSAVVTVCAFQASEALASAARRGAFYVEEGDTLTMILSGIRRYTRYDATGLLQAKRRLAQEALAAQKYIF